jgi:hypothetical protein
MSHFASRILLIASLSSFLLIPATVSAQVVPISGIVTIVNAAKKCPILWSTSMLPYSNAYLKDVTTKKEWRHTKTRRYVVAYRGEIGLPATHLEMIIVPAKTKHVFVDGNELAKTGGPVICCITQLAAR